MPDRLGDALANSQPARHHLMCAKCGESVAAFTALGARLAMRSHRKHKCSARMTKEQKLSIMENARHLVESAGEVVNDAIGASTAAAQSLDGTQQAMARVQEICENTSQTAATLLGEGHSAVETITNAAAGVTEDVLAIQQLIEELRGRITEMDAKIIALGGTIQQAGEQAMQGGS